MCFVASGTLKQENYYRVLHEVVFRFPFPMKVVFDNLEDTSRYFTKRSVGF